jgi:small-conductance mechanosensitive channel
LRTGYIRAVTRTGRAALAAALILLAAPSARAQTDTAAAAPPSAAQPRESVPVVWRGDTLFTLTAPLGSFTPAERATAIGNRLERIGSDPLANFDSLAVVDADPFTEIVLGDLVITSVTNADAEAAGMSRLELAERNAAAIRESVGERSFMVRLQHFAMGVGFTIIATIGAWLLLKGLGRLFRRLHVLVRSGARKRIGSVKIQRLELLSSDRIANALGILVTVLRVAATILLAYAYIALVFSFFPWTRGYAAVLLSYVLTPLQGVVTDFVNYLPNLFSIVVKVIVSRYLLKLIALIFHGIEQGAIVLSGFYPDWADPTYKIVRFMVIVFTAIAIWPDLPVSDSPAFRGIFAFLGILISFGAAATVANIIGGVVMVYMRPFAPGDRVKIAETVGDVVEKSLLVTRIRSVKNVDITIPNAMVLGSHIVNYSSSAKGLGLVLHTDVTIGYDVPWRDVHAVLIEAARKTPAVLETPEPFVLQKSLDDFSVRYELNVYTEEPNRMTRIYSALHENIQDLCNERGIEIMSPSFTAIRDGSQLAQPPEHRPEGHVPPPFRILNLGGTGGAARNPDV